MRSFFLSPARLRLDDQLFLADLLEVEQVERILGILQLVLHKIVGHHQVVHRDARRKSRVPVPFLELDVDAFPRNAVFRQPGARSPRDGTGAR